jgi:hypothetical protein
MADQLDVIAQLSEWAINDSLRELESRDRLTIGLREALRYGMSADELSAITGLTPMEIRRRSNAHLHVLSELESLAS